MKKILILGSEGQVGSHLTTFLKKKNTMSPNLILLDPLGKI